MNEPGELAMQRKTHSLVQGEAAWYAHRAGSFNASEASAMMCASKYRQRTDLLREKATGITPEVSDAQQRLFDAGHAAEALIRPAVELAISNELYPVTMSVEINGLNLSASLDGLTLEGDTAFEAKLWNEELAAQVRAGELHPHYYWQLEQILLCSGAERVIFATGDGAEKLATLEYRAVPGRADALVAGWKQFERDLADYHPEQEAPKPIAAPVEGFGVLAVRVEGRVLASNLDAFRAGADAFLARLPKPAELQTDQDFADADAAVKACEKAEDNIEAATKLALAQMTDVNAVLTMAEHVAKSIRAARLALAKAVTTEKENRKAALVKAGVDAVRAHYDEINATLGEHAIGVPAALIASDIGGAIKGLKTLSSMRDKIDAAVAAAKIDASQRAERVRQCIAVLAEHAEHAHLFPDRWVLCANKQPEDLRNLAAARIAEHNRREEEREKARQQQEAERIASEVQRVREAEERGRQEVKQAADAAEQERLKREAWSRLPVDDHQPQPEAIITGSRPAPNVRRIKLGDINAAIAPLSITGEGLAKLGFHPVATVQNTVQNTKFYDESSFEAMLSALARTIARADLRREAA